MEKDKKQDKEMMEKRAGRFVWKADDVVIRKGEESKDKEQKKEKYS